LVVLTWGVPFYLFGWQVAKQLIFPCTYLIFCIPLNFLDSITFPLRMLVTVIATVLLNGLGIPVERVGSGIHSLTGGFDFDVAAPCSGLRSLLAMTALTAVYANLTQKTLIKQWILFLCAIPLAVIGNLVRITSIGLVAQAFGEDLAVNLYHDYSGYVVFAVGILLMVGIGGVLNLNLSEVLKKWKQEYLNPTSS
jgi:exosortase